jgi:DNA repair exonuclease SbcCD nuclease subunit
MRLAISSDFHLGNRSETPERWNALDNILYQMRDFGIIHLIIAGDLFDKDNHNYTDFDKLCTQNTNFQFFIIPGNHDSILSQAHFAAKNITVFTETTLLNLGSSSDQFLFVPYRTYTSMGREIASQESLEANQWILISHGDYLEGFREPNPYEPGIYMPLSRTDLETSKPTKVFLGHIHKPFDHGILYYAGSPCGLEISETGRRRFLLYDTENREVVEQEVDSDILYFNEEILVLPVEDEEEHIKTEIERVHDGWGLQETEKPKARIRMTFKGFSKDKSQLARTIEDCLTEFSFFKNEGPRLDEVEICSDSERIVIAEKVRKHISEMKRPANPDDPSEIIIAQEALKIIFG